MKLLACLLVVALCAYIGKLLSGRAVQRLEFFREYQGSFVCLTDRIIGMNLELCKALETTGGAYLSGFFRSCSKTLSSSPRSRFTAIWRENLDRLKLTFLTREDIMMVTSGGEAVESLCMNPSEKQASAYIKRLSAYVEGMETEKRKKCKLYNTSGVLAGLLIALLII